MPVLKVQSEPGVWIPVDGTGVDEDGEVEPPATTSTKYLQLSGSTTSYASVFALALPSVSHRFLWEIRRPSWKGTEQKITVTKWNDAGPYGWWAAINANGSAHFRYSTPTEPKVITYCEGKVPATLPPANEFIELEQLFDGSNRVAALSWRPLGAASWTLVSSSPAGPAVSALLDSTAPFRIGASGAGNYRNLDADVRQLKLVDDKGEIVFTLDPSEHKGGTSWVTESGHTVTLSGGAKVTEAT